MKTVWRAVDMASSVDLLVLKAYWWGSRLAQMLSVMCWRTIFSKQFGDGDERHKVVVIKTRHSRQRRYRGNEGCLEARGNSLMWELSGPAGFFIFTLSISGLTHDELLLDHLAYILNAVGLFDASFQFCSGGVVCFLVTWPKGFLFYSPHLFILVGKWSYCLCDHQVTNTYLDIWCHWRCTFLMTDVIKSLNICLCLLWLLSFICQQFHSFTWWIKLYQELI